MENKKYRLMPLFFPIFLELLFMMLTGAVDTLMLASEGDQAVGAVGTANTYISIFLITLLDKFYMLVNPFFLGIDKFIYFLITHQKRSTNYDG